MKSGALDKKKNRNMFALFFVIVAIQLLRIVIIFVCEKDGKHPDESWSFGLANSYYKTHIFMTDDGSEETYKNEWISGETLKEYITVDKEHRFAFDSVIHNMKSDAHPPLFFLILHAICSFFPGKYSLWFSFSINIVVFILLQFLIFLLSLKLFKNTIAALAVVIFYGFCVGGVSTIIYTRQYALLTLFSVATVYLHALLIESDTMKQYVKYLFVICAVTFCGAMTHYFFLPFAFAISLLICIGYLLKGRIKKLLIYGFSLVSSVLLTMPFTQMSSVIGMGNSVDNGIESNYHNLSAGFGGYITKVVNQIINIAFYPDFEKRVNISLGSVLYDILGLKHYLSIPYLLLLAILLVLVFGLLWLLISFLIVNLTKGKQKGMIFDLSQKTVVIVNGISKSSFVWITMIASVMMVFYFVIGFASPLSMQQYTDRYLFMTYPFLILFLLNGITMVVKRIRKAINRRSDNVDFNYKPASLIMLVVCVINVFSVKSIYLFPRPDHEPKLEELCVDKDVVLILSQHWLLTSYTTMLYQADDIFVSLAETDEYMDSADELRKADTDELIIAVDATVYEEVLKNRYGRDYKPDRDEVEKFYLDFFESCYSDRSIDFLYMDKETRRDVFIYSANLK